jgi:hypothetical protein
VNIMARRDKDWAVWTYLDADDTPCYIAVDRVRAGKPHPAAELWENRFRENSSVATWLRGLHEIPKYNTIHSGQSQAGAMELFTSNRSMLRDLGVSLLTTRDMETFAHGGGKDKACRDDATGKVYKSARAAAELTGVDHSTIVRRIQKGKGWSYV